MTGLPGSPLSRQRRALPDLVRKIREADPGAGIVPQGSVQHGTEIFPDVRGPNLWLLSLAISVARWWLGRRTARRDRPRDTE